MLLSFLVSGCDGNQNPDGLSQQEPTAKSANRQKDSSNKRPVPAPAVERIETLLDLAPLNKISKDGTLRRIHSSGLFANNKIAFFEEKYKKSGKRGIPDPALEYSINYETPDGFKSIKMPMAYPYSISAGPYPGRLTSIQSNGHSWDVNSIDPVTGKEKNLTSATNKVAGIYWDNHGKTLLLYEQRNLKYIVTAYDHRSKKSSTLIETESIIHDIAWHPDGNSFAYSHISQSGEKGVSRYFINSKKNTQLFTAPKGKIIKSLAWDPGGDLLAYALAGLEDDCGCESLLGTYNLTSAKTATYKGLKITEIAGWSSDGRFILAQDTYLLKKIYLKK